MKSDRNYRKIISQEIKQVRQEVAQRQVKK